jgi:hypothetical protein
VQAVDSQGAAEAYRRVGHTMPGEQGSAGGEGASTDAPAPTPHPPSNPAAGGSVE